MVERFGLHRIEVWVSIFLLVMPWLLYGVEYPIQLIQELDHCPELACDFVRHYLPQAESARIRLPEMNNGWFYPPLLAMLLIPLTYFTQASLLWTIINLGGVILLIRLIRTKLLLPMLFVAMCNIITHSAHCKMGASQHLVGGIVVCVDVSKWSDGRRWSVTIEDC